MYKGISFYWGFDTNPAERAKILKQIGFDCVITNADPKFNKQNGKISKQVKWIKQDNLKISSLHMRYNSRDLPYFWTKSIKGKWMEKRLAKDIKVASKYGIRHVVTHLKGIPSQVGLERINRLLELCEKCNVDLAIENTENAACFMYTFNNILHPHLKFCLDVGHNHCFSPEINYFKDFGDKLVCLHLHDNDGTRDAHTLNKYGNIDWGDIAKNLAKIPCGWLQSCA
jgi:sugar phosphate isomerase/epimerase